MNANNILNNLNNNIINNSINNFNNNNNNNNNSNNINSNQHTLRRTMSCPLSHPDQPPDQTVQVGTQLIPTGWSTALIHFHSFETLPSQKGESTDSEPFAMHGLDWYLRLHPGGATSANDDRVSLYLRCKSAADQSNISVYAEFSLALVRNDGQWDSHMSCPCVPFNRKRKGWPNFISRSRILDPGCQLLKNDCYGGTLTVLVKVQLFQDVRTLECYVPKNDMNCKLLRLLEEANSTDHDDHKNKYADDSSNTTNTADVQFNVEGTTLYAHSLILKMSAPTLASLCEDTDRDTAIPITGVSPHIFHCLLRYAYGDDIPNELWSRNASRTSVGGVSCTSSAMELLDAANRFGVVGVKLIAESKVVQRDIAVETASDLLLYADSNDCALLKEKVVDFFLSHAEQIRKTPEFQKVKESNTILDELMEALLSKRVYRMFPLGENDVDYGSMGVNLLRKKLGERGLDVDGSREMLIHRLTLDDKAARGSGASNGGDVVSLAQAYSLLVDNSNVGR
ncbi:hypothetical protein ACHAXS_010407 [Conticribra weissflogii]